MTFGEIEILDYFSLHNGEAQFMKTAEHEAICIYSIHPDYLKTNYCNLTLKTKVDEKV